MDAGATDSMIDAIRLCVSEALTNAVMHAYPDLPGAVDVVVELADDRLLVTVRDHGQGMGGASGARQNAGGMGLRMIRTLTARCRITSDSVAGTEICMTFAPGDEPSRPGSTERRPIRDSNPCRRRERAVS